MPDVCGAKTRRGTACQRPAGWGTDHAGFGNCKLHFGATPNGRLHAAKEAASAEVARLGVAVETDPHEALALAVNLYAGQVAFLNAKVADLDEGKAVTKGDLHPMIRALQSTMDQLRQAAKAAADAGVEERRQRLDELAVAGIQQFLSAVLGDLELTADQEARIPAAMSRHGALLDELGDRPRELTR